MNDKSIYKRLICYTCFYIVNHIGSIDNRTQLEHIYDVLKLVANSIGFNGRWVLERQVSNKWDSDKNEKKAL